MMSKTTIGQELAPSKVESAHTEAPSVIEIRSTVVITALLEAGSDHRLTVNFSNHATTVIAGSLMTIQSRR